MIPIIYGDRASRKYVPWQELGYWHIGRCQVRMQKCADDEFYNDDMASNLKINHLEMTFQPVFAALPMLGRYPWETGRERRDGVIFTIGRKDKPVKPPAPLGLELLGKRAVHDRWESVRPAKRAPRWEASAPVFLRAEPAFEAASAPVFLQPEPAFDPSFEAAPAVEAVEAAPEAAPDLPEAAPDLEALLPGLGAPLPKKPRGGRGKKAAEGREPVDGMILTPGSDPLPCRVELL